MLLCTHQFFSSPEKTANGDIRLLFCLGGIQVFKAAATISGLTLARIKYIDKDRFSVTLSDKSTGAMIATVSEAQLRPWKHPVTGGDLYRLEWTESRIAPGTREVSHAVHEALAEALGAVHEWRAARSSGSDDARRLVFVTEKATWIGNTDSESDIDLAAAAVWRFVRSAQAEFGGDRVVLVDLDGSTESEDALLDALASGEEVVSLRGGKMMIPKLQKQPRVTETPQPMPLDINGTVLITGGTGGLGAILSRDLVHNQGAKNLLLVSRSGMEASGVVRELYDELKSAGAAVCVEACDVGDRSQLAALFQRHDQTGLPPITAVIHCAVDDAVLGSQAPERMARVMRPKVDATWNLHTLVPDSVRSFILFSSYVSVVGNEGQAAYTGANAFLDALARFRISRRLPALSLAWGPWKNDGGMAAQNKLLQVEVPPRIRNAEAFTDQQGLALLYKALEMQTTRPQEAVLVPLLLQGPFPLVPLPIDKGRGSRSKKSTGKSALWLGKLAAVPFEEHHDTLLALVRNEIAAVLGYQGQELPDKLFVDLGFDSFTSVMLTNRLRVLTGFSSLPVTLALDHDTPQALVQHLLSRIQAEPEREVDYFDDADDASATSNGTDPAASDRDSSSTSSTSSSSEKKSNVSPSAVSTAALQGHDDLDPEVFRGLATIHRRLALMEQYTAAATLLASAALAMQTFPKSGTSLSSYAAEPQRLATAAGPSSSSSPPVIFIAPFFPRIEIEGIGLSVYSNLASSMAGRRDIFELPHPSVQAVPQDLDTLAELHLSTIRNHFSDDNTKEIILAGYSAGGAVAYAVASKLCKQQQPKLVGFVLLDTYLTMTGQNDPDWLNALPAEALISRLQGSGNTQNLVNDLDLALAKVGGYFGTLRDWDADLHPLPDSLPTLFIRARDPSDKMPLDSPDTWRPQWKRAGCRTVDVPGSHLALLDKRFAPAIAAEILRWAMEEVETSRKE
ncbi:KR domain containing protein [Rhypophila decipiens]